MGRYEELFARLKEKHEGAFIPFVMLGDPDYDTSLKIIDALVAGGADALELGVPFSDPVADGPTIQRAHLRASAAGITFNDCLSLVKEVRARYPQLPIGMLIYGNVPFSRGIAKFYQEIHAAGADSVLLPDIPLRESAEFREAARAAQVQQVFIAPPAANATALKAIAANCEGYVYLLSRQGVTGAETAAGTDHIRDVTEKLREFGAPPAILGFGIAKPEQVRAALARGAAGAICGSAIVNMIGEQPDAGAALFEQIKDFVTAMKAATREQVTA